MSIGYGDDSFFYFEGFGQDPVAMLRQQGEAAAGGVISHGRAEIGSRARDLERRAVEQAGFDPRAMRQQMIREYGIDPAAIPTNPEQIWKQVQGRVERELKNRFDKMKSELFSKLRKAGVEGIGDLGKRLAPQAAQELFSEVSDLLKDTKVPGWVRVDIPSDATVGAVLESAGESALRSTEAFIQSKTGFPVEIPRSLNPLDLIDSVGSALPKDAKEALLIGVQVGIQYVSSALAGAIAGATIGSTIPGLGTVIGIGMGFIVSEVISEKPGAYQRVCELQAPCPLMPRYNRRAAATGAGGKPVVPLSPLGFLPWSVRERKRLSIALAQEQSRRFCQGGQVGTCLTMMNNLAQEFKTVARSTIPALGLPAIEKWIGQYELAMHPQFVGEYYSARKQRIISSRGPAGDRFIPELLPLMYLRKQELLRIQSKAQRMSQLTPSEFSHFQYPVLSKELRYAALQASLNPNDSDARQWLVTVSQWWQRWKVDQQRRQGARREQIQKRRERFEQRKGDPAWQKRAVLEQLQAQCGQDVQAACVEYRRIAGGGALTAAQKAQFQGGATPAPTRGGVAPPRQAASKRKGIDPEVFKRCKKITEDMVAKHPYAQRCLSRTDLDKLTRICAMSQGPSPQITPQKALSLMATYTDNVCKRKSITGPAPKKTFSPEEQRVRGVADAMLNDWLNKNPAQRKCVTPRMREQVRQLFVAAHVKKTISVPAATQRIFSMIGRPC